MSHAHRTSVAAPLAALLLLAAPGAASAGSEAARMAAAADPAMPAMLRLAVARGQATDVAASYQLDRAGRGANPRHGLELTFTPRGARIVGLAGGFALRLERFGRGDGRPVRRVEPRVDGAWVEYDRGAGLTEWFVNLPGGVEQGWTVARRPAGAGALVLELDTARAPEESDDRRLAWSGLVYHRLVALDADGRKLPAVWTTDGARLRIEVDDRGATYPVLIDPWVEQAGLVADDGATEDRFGSSVALAGDTALVGAPFADVGGNDNQGAAYVFTRSADLWSQEAKLTADDGAANHFFGAAVALAGDTALVGARQVSVGGNPLQGAAYVFIRSGDNWSQEAKLTAEDGAADDVFGISVAVAGGAALVGASRAEVGGNKVQGAAYVFARSGNTWSQQAKLTADDGEENDSLGISVALAGDSALVGASAFTAGGTRPGAAYVYVHSGDTWSQQAKLTADDGEAGDDFAVSVALAGDTALVGANDADVNDNSAQGAAYVFTRSGDLWSQQAKLTANDGAASDNFGISVALEGDTALVGAFAADVGDNAAQGAAYVFTRSGDTWSQQARLAADDGAALDLFGGSVALAGGVALVGASETDVDGKADQGVAYVFVPPLTPAALAVDPEPTASADGNGVFEPDETVDVAPAWRNDTLTAHSLTGTASGFTGPPGATYALVQDGADYGTLDPGQMASCLDTGICYVMGLDDPAVRPALHWDTTFDEFLTDPETTLTTTKTWTLHIGDSFTDVPRASLFYRSIETLLHHGVSGDPSLARLQLALLGCSETEFCPTTVNTRAEAAVFLLKGLEGAAFEPPNCVSGSERFDDVSADDPFCPWIEELAGRGVTAGCGGGNYCPDAAVTRAQIAVLLLKTLEGADYVPPECTGVFADVACPSPFADWIEDLFAHGITAGCGGGNYCPDQPVTRAEMAAFVVKTFGLVLYGP